MTPPLHYNPPPRFGLRHDGAWWLRDHRRDFDGLVKSGEWVRIDVSGEQDVRVERASAVPMGDDEKAHFMAVLVRRKLIDEAEADRTVPEWRKYAPNKALP